MYFPRMSFNEILNLNHLVDDPGDPSPVTRGGGDAENGDNQVSVAEEGE